MKRSPMPARKEPMKRTRLRPKKRSAAEFERIYGSKERVRWVKSLPCMACSALYGHWGEDTQSQNAHTETGGKGRKADASTIAPLCASHHRAYDEHRAPFDSPEARDTVKAYAAHVERAWQERKKSELTRLSAIVPKVMDRLLEDAG